MIRYQVRSRDLVDLVNEVKNKRLIMSPYFQRNLVWRQVHKIDFIKTILLGYPFPQIFIARWTIDVDTMLTTSCIVDWQQRMSSIIEYLNDWFKVDGNFFSKLDPTEKEIFLKYQIPIIDLDINNEDPEIIEIFQRLNRTFYALSWIEKLSTEYAASEFMLLAKFLIWDFKLLWDDDELPLQLDPTIPASFNEWSSSKKVKNYDKLFAEEDIFTSYEISRQVHLMFTLNLMSTHMVWFYNRNDFVDKHLLEFAEVFLQKDNLFSLMDAVAWKFLKLKLKKKSYWLNKANSFSLLSFFMKNWEWVSILSEADIKSRLELFESNIPDDYRIAAKEWVNNKQERLLRNQKLESIFLT